MPAHRIEQIGEGKRPYLEAEVIRVAALVEQIVQFDQVLPIGRQHSFEPGIALQRGVPLRVRQLHPPSIVQFHDGIKRCTQTPRLDVHDKALTLLAGKRGLQRCAVSEIARQRGR